MVLCAVVTDLLVSDMTNARQAAAVSTEDLEAWLARYKAAWEGRDADAAAALFSEDARYYETPYSEPFEGPKGVHEYWSRVTADQRDVDFESAAIGVVDGTGIARWSVQFKLASNGASVELNGVFLLGFGADGKCRELREWWHAR